MKATLALAGVLALAAAHLAFGADTGGQEKGAPSEPAFRPAFFSPELTNRYFPWANVERTVLEGRQKVDGKVKEYDPLSNSYAEKWHAPGVGFVKETFEDGFLVLTKVVRG